MSCCVSYSCCGSRSFGRGEAGRRGEGRGWGRFFMRRGFGRGDFGGGPGGGGFGGGPGGGGGFGVRRPLRYLAGELELDEKQIAELARILDEIKTERAQAEVDDRRTLADFADAIAADGFDSVKASAAGDRRVASATRLREAVLRCLGQFHTLLNPQQRAKLAYLVRTGVLAV